MGGFLVARRGLGVAVYLHQGQGVSGRPPGATSNLAMPGSRTLEAFCMVAILKSSMRSGFDVDIDMDDKH